MSKLEVGDRIRVKSYEEIMTLTGRDRGGFVPGMKGYCGREFVIKDIRSADIKPVYTLTDMPAFAWYDSCFEKVEVDYGL